MSEQKKSLANGHELNQETFADFDAMVASAEKMGDSK